MSSLEIAVAFDNDMESKGYGSLEQRGRVLQFGKDDRDWLTEFLAANPAPWIVTFSVTAQPLRLKT